MVGRPRKIRTVEIVKTSLNLPKPLKIQLKVEAAKEEREMGELLADALQAYFDKKRKTPGRSNG